MHPQTLGKGLRYGLGDIDTCPGTESRGTRRNGKPMISGARRRVCLSRRAPLSGIAGDDISRAQRLEATQPHAPAFVLEVDMPDTQRLCHVRQVFKRSFSGARAARNACAGFCGRRRGPGNIGKGGMIQTPATI